MRIGYCCESPADRAALAVFAEGLLGSPPEPINIDLECHGVPGFFTSLDGLFRGVHYASDAEGLIVVVDADNTELHAAAHDCDDQAAETCRLCQARKIIARARSQLKPRPGLPELKVAIGLAVPTIEAWYLAGRNHQVGEAAWKTALASNMRPFTSRQLKQIVYGTDRPSLAAETLCAVNEARRIIAKIETIEDAFPDGFGHMAREIRSWAKA